MPTPERTSTEEIVAAGREILEIAGPSGLTMQAVADRVGVRAPSLYKRVRDRDALHAAVATASIDAPEEDAILDALDETGWRLTDIFVTHHHYDHVEAIPALKEAFDARVTASAYDHARGRVPLVDATVADGSAE